MIDDNLLLFIEPQLEPSDIPFIDEATKIMAQQLRYGVQGSQILKGEYPFNENNPLCPLVEMPWNDKYDFMLFNGWLGFHDCSCGVKSKAHNFLLPGGEIVNSLCVHYLAFHREEVPDWQIEKVLSMRWGVEPTDKELAWPPRKESNV